MLAAMSRGDDKHVRALLDQRAQRADVPLPHTRFSIFSDRSDSPSLYSHFDSNYRNTPTTPAPRFPRFHDKNAYDDRHAKYPILSPAERLADPNASTLDFSEDPFPESGEFIAEEEEEIASVNPDDDDDPETRMSLLGPKMRVHSRAPWEEDDNNLSSSDADDGGNDSYSVFSGKKSSRAGIRGLGFGAKSPAPRPSFDSSTTSRDKRLSETTTSVVPNSNSRSAIHALAQASMSTSSLSLGPSSSSTRLSSKLSIGRLSSSRDRSMSTASNASEKSSMPVPLPSPRSAAYSERFSGRDSPLPFGRGSVSPHRSEFSASITRTRSPSLISQDGNSSSVHSYANSNLLSVYPRGLFVDPSGKDSSQKGRGGQISGNDSVATLAASEETVTLSHSSSAASVSIASTSGLESTTPPTSAFSLVSIASQPDLSKQAEVETDTERAMHQKRLRRETKLGPISVPSMVTNHDFETSKPYALISLEQAQARMKERNRSVTTGGMPLRSNNVSEDGGKSFILRTRARSSSAADKVTQDMVHIPAENARIHGGDIAFPTATTASKQPGSVGPPPGKVLRPRRSGFMKLFNGREKDRVHDPQPPPVPPIADSHIMTHSSEQPYQQSVPRPPKTSMHRVPVPIFSSSVNPSSPNTGDGKDDLRSKKSVPSLSIKVTSPSSAAVHAQETVTRRSDSPKSSLKPLSPKIPTSAPAGTTHFAALKLRPVSGFFSSNFSEHLICEDASPKSPGNMETSSLISPITVASSDLIPSPVNAGFNIGNVVDPMYSYGADRLNNGARPEDEDQSAIIAALKEQIRTSRKAWQRQIWELEGQVRDLRAEIDEMKCGDVCEACGRGAAKLERNDSSTGVIHRPRAKTGCGARFASGNDV
ncbi:hypothetical protein EW145_g3732 [Phellinidium pouzarii]|uniref:Uncharacterized protein n=1 Tax=Phellinidium pouzarii TaxID=167371 RepID=A0A4S4LBA8_9AGAM|nr:hypothetical protein EW145_g3732 [Phellinidium pouzarii]